MKLGLFSVSFLILLVLKLCEVITIPWFWVFFPIILGVGLLLILIPVALVFMVIVMNQEDKKIQQRFK